MDTKFQYKTRTRGGTKRNNEEKEDPVNKKQKTEKDKASEKKKTQGKVKEIEIKNEESIKETKQNSKSAKDKNSSKSDNKNANIDKNETKERENDSKTTKKSEIKIKDTKMEDTTVKNEPTKARRATLRTKNNSRQKAREEEKLLLTKTSSAFADLVLLKQKESSLDFLIEKYTNELTEWQSILELSKTLPVAPVLNDMSKEKQQKLKNEIFTQIPKINCNPVASLEELNKSINELKEGITSISSNVKESEDKCKELARFIHVETSKAYKDFDKPKKIFNTIQSTNNNNNNINDAVN